MKHAPNYQPYNDQCEGWLKLIHHKAGKLPIGMTCIVTDCKMDGVEDDKMILTAKCVRNEPGCSIMECWEGRQFRITENSAVQPYFIWFENTTSKSREGSNFKNRWFDITNGIEMFLCKGLKAYVLYDITDNTFCKYPLPDKRSDIVWGGVAKGLTQLSTHFC